jgi:ubiquinone/menaquinone biosynthesis C-methylase UbiE
MSKSNYFFYDRHKDEWERVLSDSKRSAIGMTWFANDTLDAWRHARMRSTVKPIILADADATWLTIGDGRYGTDAHQLHEFGARSVHATDISDLLLKEGFNRGFITSYSEENAESLSFPDGSFDYVFCKESFHHFPRPYAALYEMFRVARKGVILIEPRDQLIDRGVFHFIRNLLMLLARRKLDRHLFESVGNYVYSISERELDKFMLGMHYRLCAYFGINDAYKEGVEFVKMQSKDISSIYTKKILYFKIGLMNLLCRLRIIKSNILIAAIFKVDPEPHLVKEMEKRGWNFKVLPVNPYL